jgi:hypothetical protein
MAPPTQLPIEQKENSSAPHLDPDHAKSLSLLLSGLEEGHFDHLLECRGLDTSSDSPNSSSVTLPSAILGDRTNSDVSLKAQTTVSLSSLLLKRPPSIAKPETETEACAPPKPSLSVPTPQPVSDTPLIKVDPSIPDLPPSLLPPRPSTPSSPTFHPTPQSVLRRIHMTPSDQLTHNGLRSLGRDLCISLTQYGIPEWTPLGVHILTVFWMTLKMAGLDVLYFPVELLPLVRAAAASNTIHPPQFPGPPVIPSSSPTQIVTPVRLNLRSPSPAPFVAPQPRPHYAPSILAPTPIAATSLLPLASSILGAQARSCSPLYSNTRSCPSPNTMIPPPSVSPTAARPQESDARSPPVLMVTSATAASDELVGGPLNDSPKSLVETLEDVSSPTDSAWSDYGGSPTTSDVSRAVSPISGSVEPSDSLPPPLQHVYAHTTHPFLAPITELARVFLGLMDGVVPSSWAEHVNWLREQYIDLRAMSVQVYYGYPGPTYQILTLVLAYMRVMGTPLRDIPEYVLRSTWSV